VTVTRLLMVTGSLAGGGAERVASTIVGKLDRHRIEPSVCLLRLPIEYPVPGDVTVTVLDKTRAWHLPRTVLRLRRLIRATQPDVVLSMIGFVNLVTGLAMIGAPSSTRWIARLGAPPRSDGWIWHALRRLYTRAAAIVANSTSVADALLADVPSLSDRTMVIPNPTDFAAIEAAAGARLPPARPVVIAVGRLSREKRIDRLIDAFARIRAGRDCELWLVGEGSRRAELERGVAHRGVAADVRFLGQLANPYEAMRQGAVIALSSEFEGLPNALIEAQGLGIPGVAMRCGGAEEVIDPGVTGLLVPRGDVSALAAGLARLLDDVALRARFGAAAALRARERFDSGVVMRRLEDLIAC